jgi:hypothetical protein
MCAYQVALAYYAQEVPLAFPPPPAYALATLCPFRTTPMFVYIEMEAFLVRRLQLHKQFLVPVSQVLQFG